MATVIRNAAEPAEVAELLTLAKSDRSLSWRAGTYNTAPAVPMTWLRTPSLRGTWDKRIAELAGLPFEDMTDAPAFVAFRPGDSFPARHTAFDLDTAYGRVICAKKGSQQRYAEALLRLSGPDDAAQIAFGESLFMLAPGDLLWWMGADAAHKRLPESEHSVSPVRDEWAWYLMFRWRRQMKPLNPSREDRLEYRAVLKRGEAEGAEIAKSVG